MEGLQIAVLEDQVVDWAMEHVQVTEQPMSLQELMVGGADQQAEDSAGEAS